MNKKLHLNLFNFFLTARFSKLADFIKTGNAAKYGERFLIFRIGRVNKYVL